MAFFVAAVLLASLAACGREKEAEPISDMSVNPEVSVGDGGQPADAQGGFPVQEESSVVAGSSAPATDAQVDIQIGHSNPFGRAGESASENLPSTKAEILALYTKALNQAKSEKPAYKKIEYQEITEKNFDGRAINTALSLASHFMTTPEKANKNPEMHPKGGDTTWFPVYNGSAGCMIDAQSANQAIRQASCKKLSNGNYQISITLNPETDPEPLVSYHGQMFSPASKKDIDAELAKISIVQAEHYSILYHDCTATLVVNPKSNQIVSLEQIMHCLITAKGAIQVGLIHIPIDGSASLRNTLRITDFQY